MGSLIGRMSALNFVILFVIFISFAQAATVPPQSITVNIKGRILEPAPCTIVGTGEKGMISVDFGNEVMINHLDGTKYRQPVNYSLSCQGQYANSLMFRIVGMVAGFGDGLLQTTVADLGIAITNDSTSFPVNSFMNFNYLRLPQLYATPIKRPGAAIKGQPFSATAIMQVYYQ